MRTILVTGSNGLIGLTVAGRFHTSIEVFSEEDRVILGELYSRIGTKREPARWRVITNSSVPRIV